MNTAISWLRAPISVSLAPLWRMRLYGVCLALVALSVPFLHLYLHVELSLGELAVHAVDVSLGTFGILLIGWVIAQIVRAQVLRAELVELKELNRALEQARSSGVSAAPDLAVVSFRHEGRDVALDAAAITWIAAEENYCRIHTRDRQLLVRTTLLEALDKLPSRLFLRVHRSHVVGLLHVTQVRRSGRSYAVVLDRGAEVPVSRSHVPDVRAHLDVAVEPLSA